MIRDKHITTWLLLLLLMMMAGISNAWAADDEFTVTNTTGADLLYKGNTLIPTGGTYTTLTLGLAADESKDVFKIENGGNCITYAGEGFNPTITDSKPTGGHVFVLTTSQPGDFVFHVKLTSGKTMVLRNSDGVDIATKANSSGSSINIDWKVTVESAGTYYLLALGSKLALYGYTFTKKPIQGITELPYFADFSSDTEPFDGGDSHATTNVGNVLRVYNSSATASFAGGYTLKSKETVTISFTAYHGWNNYDRSSTVAVKNTSGQTLVSYTYNQKSTHVTDVSFGGETADGFEVFSGISKYNASQNANGFTNAQKPYVATEGYNPTITMTISGTGLVTFNFNCSGQSVQHSYSTVLEGMVIDLGSIVISDANTRTADAQDDRCIGIDNLSITSELYSSDYENTGGLTDWTTATAGRYTPIIAEDASGNHYMTVNQDQRNNNGTILTNNSINGSALTGENFTLEFDMKLGRSNRDQTPTKFTVYASDNTTGLFTMADKNTEGNKWDMTVAGHDAEEITLAGDATGGIDAITWHHYKLSYTGGRLYVTITSLDGTTYYKRAGYDVTVSGLSKMTFDTKRYYANFAFDNLKVSAYANTNFSVSGKTETYTINSTGDLPQVDEGKTITIEYGEPEQMQMTKTNGGNIGAFCLDNNITPNGTGYYTRAWGSGANVAPNMGTYYKFTPKFNGKLTIVGNVEVEEGKTSHVTLRTADGTVKETISGSTGMSHTFTTELTADTDYYLFAETDGTGGRVEGDGEWATLFLTGFSFEQTSMNREIKVSDLLYTGDTDAKDGKLYREIPGFQLSYSGDANVQTTANGQGLTISNGGSITIKLRENGYEAKISNITLNISEVSSATVNGESITATGKHSFTISPDAATATLSCTAGSLTITSLSVGYTGDDNNNTAMWLDDEKTTAPTLTFSDNHLMQVPGDGQAFTQVPTVSPSSFNAALTYTSDNNTIATINSDGTNGQLLKSGEATITASFAETDYFNSATASYTVSNVLKPGETYTRSVTDNQTVRIDAKASAASTDLTLTGTLDNAMTLGTDVEKHLTTANATTVTLTNNTSNDITIENFRNYSKRLVAYLYYEGQEENYSEQLVFQSFPSGPVKGFRVLDIGDPTDPIDLTEAYSLKSDAEYVWTDGSLVGKDRDLGGTFSTDNGGFTVSSKGSGDETSLPIVGHVLTKTGTADGYADEITAESNIYVATPTTDGDDTYYYVWDMTASISAAGQLDSRWTWNGHGYYQAWMPEYLPILSNNGQTLAGNEGLLVKGDLRYHIGSTGLRMNLTSVNAHLKFPVKAGMEVKIVMASAAADIEHIISNVTTVKGDATKSLYIEQAGVNTPITAYYLAKADGAIEIHSMDKMGGYIKSITLQVPRIHFNEEIITVKNQVASLSNPTINTGDATITYSILGSYDLDGTTAGSTLAEITDANKNNVNITTTNEGYVIVKAVNPSATGVQPKQGTYRIYMIDFGYTKDSYYKDTDDDEPADGADFPSLDLASEAAKNNGGEAWFDKRPEGYEKVVQPVTYTMSVVDGSPRGRLIQTTDSDPTKTTYKLSAYSAGTIRVTATTGRISTYTDVYIEGGDQFAETAPARRLTDLEKEGNPAAYYFLNELPTGFGTGNTTFTVDKSGGVECGAVTTTSAAIDDVTHYYAKIANITGYGAIRVTATNDNNTPSDATDDKTASFILTVAYPASTGQKWDFYRMKHYNSSTEYGLFIGTIDSYNGEENQTAEPNPRTITSSTETQHKTTGDGEWNSSWTTSTKWEKVYRKGDEQPRWAYAYSMRGDNAFIIEETAGLIIETGPRGFYTDNPVQPDEFAFNHIGLHNNASVTIPQLKKGDYIALNLDRVLPNNGAILSATNVEDLTGNPVNHTFTISRSQTDYQNAGATVKDASGARVIPGYYTFRAAADGDVTFTLEDEGYLNILSIEIYDGSTSEANVTNTGNGKDANGYYYTMTDIKVDDYPAYSTPVPTMLKEDDDTQVIDLAICNVLWSTSVGPADYVVMDEVGNLNATLENVEWVSDRGALYNKGRITVNEGYGRITVRMNNYTADGRYLIGYTPDYSLTVGHPPHQDYPFTWNFENISGGAVKGRSNNAFNNITSDFYTWKGLGYEAYQLDTRTSGGSLYVPGATLVTASRDLGAKGTINELNSAGLGCDEFNGLGFNGQITIRTALQGTAEPTAPETNGNNSLLSYRMSEGWYMGKNKANEDSLIWKAADLPADAATKTYWTAGDGQIRFVSAGKRTAAKLNDVDTYVYYMDGGSSKCMMLKPERPFQEGDKISLKGFVPNNVVVLNSGFSFYAAQLDNAYDDLVTIHWKSSDNTQIQELEYTVKQGDGLAGRDSVYLFRAGKQYSVYLTEISITGDDSTAPTIPARAITCNGAVTVTIPDLQQGHYVYIKSSAPPSVVPAILTAAVAADGLDAATSVYKYKVLSAGNADVTFDDGTEIDRIGVTNILKTIKRVGSGDAWATESRDHAIDYKQTGQFTVNDITPYTVTATGNNTLQKATVQLNEKTDAIPAETGLVLKRKMAYAAGDKDSSGNTLDADGATTATNNALTALGKTNSYDAGTVSGKVPLFYPPHSTPILNGSAVRFGGTEGNLMMANLDKRVLTEERETGVIDKNGDDTDDSGDASGTYTRFIFADLYMKWTKVTSEDKTEIHRTAFTESGNVPVFYRLHIYDDTEATALSTTKDALNTIGANKAYLLARSALVPDAIWNSGGSGGAKQVIGITGISDFDWIDDDGTPATVQTKHDGIYNLQGQKLSEDTALPAGIYIINGRKVAVK